MVIVVHHDNPAWLKPGIEVLKSCQRWSVEICIKMNKRELLVTDIPGSFREVPCVKDDLFISGDELPDLLNIGIRKINVIVFFTRCIEILFRETAKRVKQKAPLLN